MAEVFGTDPLVLLNCDENDWILRLACAQVIVRDREKDRDR